MKLAFTGLEMDWLRNTSTRVALFLYKDAQAERKLLRQSFKLMNKFTPNAKYVSLNVKERDFLFRLAQSRLLSLTKAGSTTQEIDTTSAIMEKLSGQRLSERSDEPVREGQLQGDSGGGRDNVQSASGHTESGGGSGEASK